MTIIKQSVATDSKRPFDRRRGVRFVWLPILALVFCLVPSFALAQDPSEAMREQMADLPTGPEAVDQIMKGLGERLALSSEQEKEVRPHIEQMVASMKKLRDRFQAGELKPMALGMQIQMAEKKASVQIDPILDEKQRAEYAALRQEQRRRMMEEMRKRATRQP